MTKQYITTICLIILGLQGITQNVERLNYKEINDTCTLYMDVYSPTNMDENIDYPSIAFFFGGGWKGRNYKAFKPYAKYFATRGMVCFVVDYRVKNVNGTSPFECVKDAKSAMRYIRSHADRFNIDANKIVASGGSAGGHLAAATALISGYNEDSDDLSVSCIPNALVLFNPVIDNSPEGYGYKRIGEEYIHFSPFHNISAGAPPTIFFLGTKDKFIPVSTSKKYKQKMEEAGSRCDLLLYEGAGHSFFDNEPYLNTTIFETDKFLNSLGLLEGEPSVSIH